MPNDFIPNEPIGKFAEQLPTFNPTSGLAVGTLGNTGGRRPQFLLNRSLELKQWGEEYLFRWMNAVGAGTAATVALVGDSNTAQFVGPALQVLLQTLPNITVLNYGVGGSTIAQWLNNTGPIQGTGKDITAVITAAPDLIVFCYGGTNEPYYGGTKDFYEASLRTAITVLRAAPNGSKGRCGIVLCTASPMNDGIAYANTSEKRDMLFNAEVRGVIQRVAQEFECAFFDKNARFPDAFVDFAVGSVGVNTWLDNNRVHTQNALTSIIAGAMYEFLVPYGIRPVTTIPNPSGTVTTRNATETPIAYPKGLSIYRAITGFPLNGFVFTVNPTDGNYPMQTNFGFAGENYYFVRFASGGSPGTWGAWQFLGSVTSQMNPGTGFTNSGTEALRLSRTGLEVVTDGFLAQTVPAVITSGQTLGTAASTLQYPIIVAFPLYIDVFDGTNWERLRAQVSTSGVLTAQQTGTLSATRVYFRSLWRAG